VTTATSTATAGNSPASPERPTHSEHPASLHSPDTPEATTISQPSAAPQGDHPDAADNGARSIEAMRAEIDEIDAELVRLIQRRSEISHAIGTARAAEGGTRIVYSREMKVLDRFAVLGPAGTELGMLLLSLGRGQLGRR
jgi:chorismate mutase